MVVAWPGGCRSSPLPPAAPARDDAAGGDAVNPERLGRVRPPRHPLCHLLLHDMLARRACHWPGLRWLLGQGQRVRVSVAWLGRSTDLPLSLASYFPSLLAMLCVSIQCEQCIAVVCVMPGPADSAVIQGGQLATASPSPQATVSLVTYAMHSTVGSAPSQSAPSPPSSFREWPGVHLERADGAWKGTSWPDGCSAPPHSMFQMIFCATVCAMSIGGGAERVRLVALVPFILVRRALAVRWAALTESSAASAALVNVRVLVCRLR